MNHVRCSPTAENSTTSIQSLSVGDSKPALSAHTSENSQCNLQHPVTSRVDIGDSVEKIGPFYVKNGEFSDVWKGIFKQRSEGSAEVINVTVAIKVLRGAPAYNHDLHLKVKTDLTNAACRWINLRHSNILPFYGIVYDYGYLPAMVCSYCNAGNVLDYMRQNDPPEQRTLELVYHVIKGLHYLHSKDVIHGDLRAANVLVVNDGNAVLADYGLTFIIDHGEFTTTKVAGPARWTAPEILEAPDDAEEGDALPYSTKSDMFAFAMTAIEIITGSAPFRNIRNDSAVIFRILEKKRPDLPDIIRDRINLKDAIEKCWAHDPLERPDAHEIEKLWQACAVKQKTS